MRRRQAFENLFRNAIEHGAPDVEPPGDGPADGESSPGDRVAPGTFSSRAGAAGTDGPTAPEDAPIRVRIGRTDGGFYVADDGPGIEPDQRDAVFEPGHTTAPDGTGFGLAIVERIAEAHGWTVSVTESGDGGARFEFDCGVPAEGRDRPESASDEASARVSGVAREGER